MSTNIRRRVAKKRNTRRLVQRRVKQIGMRMEGSTLNTTEF